MFSIRARLFHLGTENQIYPKMAKFVTFVWKVLETWFWCLSPGFGTWEIHWDHCQTPQIDLSGQSRHLWSFWLIKIRYRGLKMAKFVTFVWKVLETWFWCLSPGFGTWKVTWGHCQTPQIDLNGQNGHFWSFCRSKLGTVNFSLESPRDLTLVSICRFVAMGNHLGPFLNNSVWPEFAFLTKWN